MWKHCSSPPLLLIYAYGQPNPTHVLSFSSPSPSIFAMGRCCSLSTRSTCRNPRPIAPTATALPYTYSTSYPMLAFIYNIYIIATIDMFLCSYSPYPCNSNPISTVYIHYTGLVCIMYLPLDVCIYIMYIYQMQAMYNTCCFPSPSATQPSTLPISTRPTSSRWVPPYVPWFCLRLLPDSQDGFSCPCCHCACTKGVQALGSVKRLKTIVLLWRYINKIELKIELNVYTILENNK